jgi:activator of HSP90 ATPase
MIVDCIAVPRCQNVPVTDEVGKTAGTGWQIGVSRALPYPLTDLWEFLVSAGGTEIWLGPGAVLPRERGESYETASGTTGELRSFRGLDRVRLTWRPRDWDHDSTVQFTVSTTGSKTTLRFHQEWLANAEERAQQREHWSDVIERIAAAMAGHHSPP